MILKKNNSKVVNDNIYKLCNKMINFIHQSSLDTLQLYEYEYNNLLFEKNYLLANEPFKLLKKKHKKWGEKLQLIEQEI